MADDSFGERRKALEDSFFVKKDRELLEQMRRQVETEQRKEQLAAASGIHQEEVLQKLLQLNISAETLAALSLVPLVMVAWADGSIDDKERAAALAAAKDAGLAEQDAAYQLLSGWLESKPDRQLVSAWKDYVAALVPSLDDNTRRSLEEDLIGRARRVAAAAGGILGLGKISDAEQAVLDDLQQAFR